MSSLSPKIQPVILAAGDSSRMGYPKALLPLGEETFVTRILSTLERSGFAQPSVVLGADAPRIMAALEGRRAAVIVNPHPERGQSFSLQLALERIPPAACACLVWPVDHPAVTGKLLRDLVRLFADAGADAALPRCGLRRGHPAIFGRRIFPELLALPPGVSVKRLLHDRALHIAELPTAEGAAVEDIDTPDDYYRLTGEELEAALARRGISWTRRAPAGA